LPPHISKDQNRVVLARSIDRHAARDDACCDERTRESDEVVVENYYACCSGYRIYSTQTFVCYSRLADNGSLLPPLVSSLLPRSVSLSEGTGTPPSHPNRMPQGMWGDPRAGCCVGHGRLDILPFRSNVLMCLNCVSHGNKTGRQQRTRPKTGVSGARRTTMWRTVGRSVGRSVATVQKQSWRCRSVHKARNAEQGEMRAAHLLTRGKECVRGLLLAARTVYSMRQGLNIQRAAELMRSRRCSACAGNLIAVCK
jgi:hypothetical protein